MPAGRYTTTHFFNGHLTVEFPGEWESHEDQGVEFSVAPAGKWDVHRVLFWSDLLPALKGKAVAGVPNTAQGMQRWLSTRPNLSVSRPRPVTIGAAALPAAVLDISVAKKAKNEEPGCPSAVCVSPFTWPNAGANLYGFGPPYVLRLYLADIQYGGQQHLLAVAVEGKDASDLKTFAPLAQKVIESMEAPIDPA